MMQEESESNINEKPSVKNLRRSERVAKWFIDYVYKCIQSLDVKVDPFDTLVLKTHYNFTSHLFLALFVFVTSHLLAEEPAICVDRSDKSPPPEELLEVCLTYPYVEFPYNNDRNRMTRQYALHYKWVHISCLLVSFMYKAVLVVQAVLNKYKCHRKMLEEVCQRNLKDRFVIAERYFFNNKGCHKQMYARFLYLHLIALFINIISFFALNITFQNRYLDLPKYLFMKRDPISFHDPYSLIFPPFVLCEITSVHHILVDRTKWFGCHLPLMEIYEKVFMIFWFWQVALALWTVLFILYNIPLSFCYTWKLNLLSNYSFNFYSPVKNCAKSFSLDEIFSLRAIGNLISGDDYVRLLSSLLHNKRKEGDPDATVYYDPLNKNSELNMHSSFQSCIQESKNLNDTPPIGFHVFASPIKPPADLESSTNHKLRDNEMKSFANPYTAWKRSVSMEFDTSPLKRSMAFNVKLYPLMQYLRKDENFIITSSTPTLSFSHSGEENSEQGTYSQNSDREQYTKAHYAGGEKETELHNEYEFPCNKSQIIDWQSIYEKENIKINMGAALDVNPQADDNWNEEENWNCQTDFEWPGN